MNKILKRQFFNTHEYILDEDNSLLLMKKYKPEDPIEKYIVVHYRMQDGEMVEVNRWFQNCFWHRNPKNNENEPLVLNNTLLVPFGSFFVREGYDCLYDFKKGEFTTKSGDWSCITYDICKYAKYNCLVAHFHLLRSSDDDHVFSYYDPVAHKKIKYTFNIGDYGHYAILNLDGTIRDDKVFIGRNMERIEKVVDLTNYASLGDYKEKIVEELEKELQNREIAFYQSLQNLGNGNIVNNINCMEELTRTLNKKQ